MEVRYARPSRRELEQLAELVVMNERMAGRDAARARNRVNHLKNKKANWEAIFNTLVEQDAVATLDAIESANRRVEIALSDDKRETMGVSDLKDDLERLQLELEAAHSKLHETEAMLSRNLNRVKKIESEARELRNDCEERGDCDAFDPGLLTLSMDEDDDGGAGASSAPAAEVYRNPPRGLSMFWYPAVLSSSLPEGGTNSVGFELLGTPLVVFRDNTGAARCLKDECAHRACPLSLGPVIDGQIQCAYHGWQFDGRGSCQKMPSTRYMKGIKVRSLPCVEAGGVIQVWPCEDSVPSTLPDEEVVGTPEGLDTVLELSMLIPTDHQFLLENLMDLESDRGEKAWPRGFPMEGVLNWMFPRGGPEALSMTFEPACTVVSSIGLGPEEGGQGAGGRKLYQTHTCLPSGKGQTRLLYRLALNFTPWPAGIPGAQELWLRFAEARLEEDLNFLAGLGPAVGGRRQSSDELGGRYREWCSELEAMKAETFSEVGIPQGSKVKQSR